MDRYLMRDYGQPKQRFLKMVPATESAGDILNFLVNNEA